MTLRKLIVTLAIVLSLSAGNLVAQDDETASDEMLTIGSVAPTLDIEHWVQDGDGEFEPVTKFEEGNVYLVEFWATWCGPCIASMPHLSETQEKYADQGFQIISVSDEDLETVEEFLEGDVRGDADITYKELTGNYCLTTDPDESVNRDYMAAAGQNGIPTAFIVGKSGHIEWIGHPLDKMDEAIEQVINDEWDREKFSVAFKPKQKVDALMASLSRKLRAGKEDEVIDELAKAIEESEDEAITKRLTEIRSNVMISSGHEGAADALKSLVETSKSAEGLNRIAWGIVENHDKGEEVSEELICAAIEAAEKGIKLEPKAGHIIDTLAHLEYIQGNLDKAIELAAEAAELSGDQFPEIEKFLEELEEEKAKKESGDSDEDSKEKSDDKDDSDDDK